MERAQPAGRAGPPKRAMAAQRLLAERGLPGASVTAVGPRGEIAAVRAPSGSLDRLAELAPELEALGFEHVALDLATADEE